MCAGLLDALLAIIPERSIDIVTKKLDAIISNRAKPAVQEPQAINTHMRVKQKGKHTKTEISAEVMIIIRGLIDSGAHRLIDFYLRAYRITDAAQWINLPENDTGPFQRTPLMVAIQRGHHEMAKVYALYLFLFRLFSLMFHDCLFRNSFALAHALPKRKTRISGHVCTLQA